MDSIGAKPSGSAVKPKFTPKAQIRTTVVQPPTPPVVEKPIVPVAAHVARPGKGGRDGGRGGAGRGGRGGRAEIILGRTFFSGANDSASTVSSMNYSIGGEVKIKSEPSDNATSSFSDGSNSGVSFKQRGSNGNESSSSSTVKTESDLLMRDDGEDDEDLKIRQLCSNAFAQNRLPYNPLSPISLQSFVKEKTNEIPFAACAREFETHEDHQLRIKAEEANDIFLIQLPSTLKLPQPQHTDTATGIASLMQSGQVVNMTPSSATAPAPTDAFLLRPLGGATTLTPTATVNQQHSSSLYDASQICTMKPGHIGKLQIMKSGKIYLILDSQPGQESLKHQVNVGVNMNFVQSLLSVGSSHSDNGVDSTAGVGNNTANNSYDTAYVLGNVTRKLVITPVFV